MGRHTLIVNMPPTERLYYDDAFLTSFSAQVTDIREYSRKNGQSLWQIALDRTAFYPTSGGQPHDLGTLSASARSGAVLTAEIDEVVEDEDGEVWHMTTKPLLAGTAVTGTIQWERRLDHMQQHTGQHLLSAIFAEDLRAATVSFHLGESSSTIDLAADTPEAQSAILAGLEKVERRVNVAISRNTHVSQQTVSNDEAKELLAAGKVRKLPPREGSIRLVQIPELDLNACGGTHVSALGQIGSLLLRSTERVKKGVRVEFVCGLRAVTAARQDYSTLARIAAALSTKASETPSAVDRLLAESKAFHKERQKLREELANHHAVQLAVEERIDKGLRLVKRSFYDRDPEYIKLLASRLIASVPQTAAIFVSLAQEPAAIVIACNRSVGTGCGDILKEALAAYDLRGGGSTEIAQAQVPGKHAFEISESIAAMLRANTHD